MPMQVAHVVPLAARIGGYERQALLLATSQARRGISASIVTHSDHALQLAGRTRDVELHPVQWRLGRASARLIDAALGAATVVHVHAIDPFSAAVVARARRRGIPTIVKIATQGDARRFADPESNPPEVVSRRFLEPWRLRRQQRQMREAWSEIRHSERFIALSSAIEAELLEVGIAAARIMRLPNAVLVPETPINIRPQARRAIFIGRLEERKRVRDLIAALEIVQLTHPEAELHIVGEGSNRQALESAGSATVFHGVTEETHSHLASADLFVFPSEREGCPNALLEAAAAGVPCIATSIPGIVDWFDDSTMILIEPGRPELIAQAWEALWDDSVRRTTLAEAQRTRIRAIADVTILVEAYRALYEDLAAPVA